MARRRARLTLRQGCGWLLLVLVLVVAAGIAVWRGDILRAKLDPNIPFQAYDPPPAPDYADPGAWALRDAVLPQGSGDAAVFFVHPTTFAGAEWLAPIGDPRADAFLERVVLPNYAGPFARAGVISAPRYRQAGLYARLTLRDDAREARAFAYRDIAEAFEAWLARHPEGPIVLAGVEQGADLLDRLLRERVAADEALRGRLAAVYLIDTLVPADRYDQDAAVLACTSPIQVGCVVAWSAVGEGDESAVNRRLRRAVVWNDQGWLEDLGERTPLCVNPVLGAASDQAADARRHRGGASATGLEWGARPPIQSRLTATQCRDGVLRFSEPNSPAFHPEGSWTERRMASPYNLFWADLEQDVEGRLTFWREANPVSRSPAGASASRTAPPEPGSPDPAR
ncbi:DUF3089 domain-containing protein [Brevundimonas lutea]|uniref:DUF3089 domain-containing protein n=1 Tax=Brevundimonas lutea TaxID=2293980 RepID=UPI00196AA999|nr:DUF3089 domain-containing protein [Brevundimonas lutea]